MKNFFLKNFAPATLLTIVIVISLLNFKPGTILTGWDNLHPEFNFAVNIQRSIFAVWQEYQGLGLLGGMGHASDLVRQLILAIAGTIIPADNLRLFWTITTLALGSIGTYVFVKSLLIPYQNHKREMFGFFGGLFYLLNL